MSVAENMHDHRPPGADDAQLELTLHEGSKEPFSNAGEEGNHRSGETTGQLIQLVEFQRISRDSDLTPKQKACIVAAGILQNASISYDTDQLTQYGRGDFAEMYTIAEYLASAKGDDAVDIVVEIIDEGIESEIVPPMYSDVLEQAKKLQHQLAIGRTGDVAAMMIRLWAVFEADIELPDLFDKIRRAAVAREVKIIKHYLA